MATINLTIEPTTGGCFQLPVRAQDSINDLKQAIATKFKLTKEQIVLLWRESKLDSGTIASNSIEDGSKIRLVPCIETGLVAPHPSTDSSAVLTALNTLNNEQVSEFLSGKSPLNLTMRLGEHVMLIQLQLSRVAGAGAGTAGPPKQTDSRSSSPPPASSPTSSSASPSTSLSSASRHLTRTLKKLSSTVGKGSPPHLQKQSRGVYSGTFSGTLNPSLQDGEGRPHENVSTIVHILNDLLGTMEEDGQGKGVFRRDGSAPTAGGRKRRSQSSTAKEGTTGDPCPPPPKYPSTETTATSEDDQARLTEKLKLLKEKLRGRRRRTPSPGK